MQCYASMVHAVIMCLYVCHMPVLCQKWLKIESCKQRHMIAKELYSFLMPKTLAKFNEVTPNKGTICRLGRLKSATFDNHKELVTTEKRYNRAA